MGVILTTWSSREGPLHRFWKQLISVMLVVEPTHLKKYASQTWESSPIFRVKLKHVPNHHRDGYFIYFGGCWCLTVSPQKCSQIRYTQFFSFSQTPPIFGGHHTHMFKKRVASMSWTCWRCLEHVPNIVSQMVIYHGRIRKTSPKTTPRFAWFKSAFQLNQNPRIRIATWMSRWKLGSMVSKWVISPTLRIQVCPKEGIILTFLVFLDGIGTLNPVLGRGLDS